MFCVFLSVRTLKFAFDYSQHTICYKLINHCNLIIETKNRKNIDMSLRILDLRGRSPYEAGRIQGVELREELINIQESWNNFLFSNFGKLGGYVRDSILKKVSKILFRFPRPYFKELEGMADGSGVEIDTLKIINCFDDFRKRYFEQIRSLFQGCSALAYPQKNSSMLIGLNLDYGVFIDELRQTDYVLIYDDYLNIPVCPGHIGVLRGMNRWGVFLGHNASPARGGFMKGWPTELFYRYVISVSRNADSLKYVLNKWSPKKGSLVTFGDACKVYIGELAPKRKMFHGPFFDTPAIVTNHFVFEEMIVEQVPPSWSDVAMIERRYLSTAHFSGERYGTLKRITANNNLNTPEKIRDSLREVGHEGTVATCVIDPVNIEVWVAVDGFPNSTHGNLEKVDGKDFWL